MNQQILIVDKGGNPKEWCDFETAVCYYAREKVVWELGDVVTSFRGGWNHDGDRSVIEIRPILGVTGPVFGNEFFMRETVFADREIVFARDKYICAYCANRFERGGVTVDHIMPRSRGGKNTWMNCVTACRRCNSTKDDMTPEEAGMPLVYVPYAPTVHERLLLKGRRILADQMEYLMSAIPKTSRVWQ
jgi:hypothetical protein